MNAERVAFPFRIQHSELEFRPVVYACRWTSLVLFSQAKKRFFEIVGRGGEAFGRDFGGVGRPAPNGGAGRTAPNGGGSPFWSARACRTYFPAAVEGELAALEQ